MRNVSSLYACSDVIGCGRPVESKPLDHQVYAGLLLSLDQ